MLSFTELRRAARILQGMFPTAVLRKVVQPDGHQLVLTLERPAGKSHLVFSCHPELAWIGLTDAPGPDASPGSFSQYARAHLIGSTLSGIEISETNRQIVLGLRGNSGSFALILSILGPRSNLYLLDADGKLLHSLRSLDETRRDLSIGGLWRDPEGRAPSEGVDRWDGVPDRLYLEALTETCRALEEKHKAESLARRIVNAINKERNFLSRKSGNLQEDLADSRQADAYKRKGELLKGALHTVKPGAASVLATDYQTGEAVEIPLDPTLSPAANLKYFFTRYQKISRGEKIIQQQLEELEAARSALDAAEARLDKALQSKPPDLPVLEALAEESIVRRLIHRHARGQKARIAQPKQPAKKGTASRLLPKRFRTQDGLEIWVGRNDEGNDFLTTRLARGNDLFFHLEGYPGSHVILRTEGRSDPPPRSLLDACELAVHFSKMKAAGTADVHAAPVKNVKKPKGAKPGLVYVRGGKTIHLRRDARRLQNILASRLDA